MSSSGEGSTADAGMSAQECTKGSTNMADMAASSAVAVPVSDIPRQQEKPSAPQFSASDPLTSPHKPGTLPSVSQANPINRSQQQAAFPLDPAARRPPSTASLPSLLSLAAHPMWPPVVPSTAGSSHTSHISHTSHQQSPTVRPPSEQPGSFMPFALTAADPTSRNSPRPQHGMLMAAAAQGSHQPSPAAGPTSAPVAVLQGSASNVPMRSVSDAGHAPVTATNSAAQAPCNRDHCHVTPSATLEGNYSGLSLPLNYRGILGTLTGAQQPLAQGSQWADQSATWPGSLGLYSDQEAATVRIALASKQPINLLQRQSSTGAVKLMAGLQAVHPGHGVAESTATVARSVYVSEGGAAEQVQVRDIPAADPWIRPADGSTTRRTLRMSSSELQEAVKASLPSHGKQPVQPGLPTSSNLDMELSTLNISSLDSELLGLVLVGRGGSGLVFRAVWQGAQVAVKFMIGKNQASVSMGALEAVLAASVNHPNVVQTYGFDVTRVRESSFRHSNSHKVDDNELNSSAIVSILQDLEREKTRGLAHATVDDRVSHGSSLSVGGSPANSAELKRLVLTHANTQGGVNANLMASFNSEEGFGEPTELVPANGWSLAQVLHALDTQPGMSLIHIIMEFCDRGTLLSALQRGVFKVGGTSGDASRFNDRVVCRAALRTARDVARGMQHLHASGIIHGDLKPGNVLLKGSRSDRRGFTAKVADFGLSKVVCGNALLEMHQWSTVTHMAPEVIQGTWCKQSDVYSFGVLLWQLVCGEPLPFKDLTIQQLVLGVSQGRLRLQWPPHCHPAVAKLGEACVAFEASVRPSFREIGDVLAHIEQNVRNELRWAQQAPASGQAPQH